MPPKSASLQGGENDMLGGKMRRINSLESLRGLMALWVVVGHTIKNSGYSKGDLGIGNLLTQPGLAVDVFIILSGFVISLLLDKKDTGYRIFIVRRWFRLAPVYLVLLTVSLILLDWQLAGVSSFPYRNTSVANNIAIMSDAKHYLVEQFLAHVLMIHGAISDAILPNSQYAFLGAAWSISVEWQFYLIAPFLIEAINQEKWRKLTVIIALICGLHYMNYGGEGFSVRQAGYFIIGISSYYVWKCSERWNLNAQHIEILTVLAIGVAYLFLTRWISILIWLVVFSAILAGRLPGMTKFQSVVLWVLHLRGLQWLGKISYSMYMVHMLIFYGFAQAFLGIFPEIEKAKLLALLLPCVTLGTLAVSSLTYRYIELPGIELGQRLSLAWTGRVKAVQG